MEQPSSSSKVTVEYFDPSSVYQLLSPGLLPRLPLRNLHWESHAGPLRSIPSLHVDLTPNNDSQPLSPTSTNDITRVKSSESTSSADDGFRTQAVGTLAANKDRPDATLSHSRIPQKGRRHQIPGLRQTPYLKIFLLRCDDNEIYKSHARKQVREWIKDNTPPAQSTSKISSQENHDAFEWLIIHVVIPNTAAATQPRISAKGGSTIFEKLRADFNGTSKSAVDRVAQIRIGVNDVPYDILPRVIPAIPGSYSESAEENEEAWQDLVLKFKSLILASFDMRVSQYEEDIREKDAQRTLPGWNFCTFFVLKEGLARGFESVGLVEDSLVGYDELSVGLDTTIREKAAMGSGAEHGSSFLPYTEDLLRHVQNERAILLKEKGISSEETDGPIDLQSTAESNRSERDEIPLSAAQKQYRDLILSNDISIFDFKCYLFARQLSLLLRMANAWSSREELLAKLKEQQDATLKGVAARLPPQQTSDDSENLTILAEICRRALDFITSISRIIRDDLLASELSYLRQKHPQVASQDLQEMREPYTMQIIENVVSSFTFSVAQQILAQTSTTALPIPASTMGPPSSHAGQEPKSAIPEPKTMMHPARTTSLSAIPSVQAGGPVSPGVFPGRRLSSPDQNGASKSGSAFFKTGIAELASYRAELYLLSRNVLERLGTKRSWFVGWEAVAPWLSARSGKLEDIDLHAQSPQSIQAEDEEQSTPFLHGLINKLLRTALDNKDDFYRLYETLTDKCLRHYTVADQTQSVQASMADLALLKFHLNDYAAATSFFYRMTPFYGERGWEEIEMRMLVLYSKCLRELKRNDEYVRVTLKLLAKGAAQVRDTATNRLEITTSKRTIITTGDEISIDGYLNELMTVIPTLQNDITVPLQYFFASIEVVETPLYDESQDSFALEFKLHYLLDEELHVNKLRAKMVPISGGHSRDIWLENSAPTVIKGGNVRLQFHSNLIIPGTYVIKQIVLSVGKMMLSYEAEEKAQILSLGSRFFKCPHIVLYQRPEAFDIHLSASKYMHLDRNRSLEVALSSGWNKVLYGELHIRAATAGLRLQTSEVTLLTGKLEIKQSEAGVIRFGALEAGASSRLRLPFNLEREVNDIALKIEVSYTTEQGTFFYAYNHSISIILSLGVNVQDVFKHKALFSKFTISSATSSPLRLLSSRLEGSDLFDASSGGVLSNPLVVFPRQPASVLYKITRRPQTSSRIQGKSSLSLILDYTNLTEEIDSALDSVLTDVIRATPFWQYSRIVVPIVLSHLHSQLTSYDMERTAITGKLSTSMLSNIQWRRHFVGLGRSSRNKGEGIANLLSEWLETWVENTPFIELPPITGSSPDAIPTSRQIIIPVDVPSVNVVHTADLKIPSRKLDAGASLAFTDEAIAASLHIKWTRIWETKSKPEEDGELGFVYEVSAPNDTWLLGGKRKGHFKVPVSSHELESAQPLEFPILMIPMKEGYLPYPSLEIKPILLSKVAHPHLERHEDQGPVGGDDEGMDKEAAGVAGGILSEVDYKNVGEVIRVISDAQRTTVSLDASGPQGGAWLLEIERRGSAADLFVG